MGLALLQDWPLNVQLTGPMRRYGFKELSNIRAIDSIRLNLSIFPADSAAL
jgi:hypothetical protein